MRVDKFINTTNIVKRRTVADDMCKNGVVKINDVVAKSSKEVKIGDLIEITYLKGKVKYEVLDIPKTKTIPKSSQNEFVKEVS